MTPDSKNRRLYFETVDRLAHLCGISERTAQRALAKLVKRGLLIVFRKGGGRAKSTVYNLALNGAEEKREASFVAKPRHSYDGVSRPKPRQGSVTVSGETPTDSTLNPDKSGPKPRQSSVGGILESIESQPDTPPFGERGAGSSGENTAEVARIIDASLASTADPPRPGVRPVKRSPLLAAAGHTQPDSRKAES